LLGALPSPRRAWRRFGVSNASQNSKREARMKHLVRFLGLAAGLAFAAGTVLAGIALLLAMPAYADESGLRLRHRGDGESMAAPLLSTDVSFRVTGPVARARVVQTFRNPHDAWYEGVYVFPLPETGAVDRLRLLVGEQVTEGEIRERAAAKLVYDQARNTGRRAALLDQERPSIFTTQVANIGPRETVVVELEYQQILRFDGGRFSLRFPMVVGPRYVPAGLLRVADTERITPPVMRAGSEGPRTNPVSIRVALDAGVPLASIQSSYHRVEITEKSTSRHEISLANGVTPANRDFELSWTPRAAELPQVAWFTEAKDGRHYALLMVLPPAAALAERLPREVIFVLDTSGSMAGTSIRQAREALTLALERLAPGDRFNVIEFNSTARALYREARHATRDNLRDATHWVAGLEARGGTEMAHALNLALPGSEAGDRVRQVIFLTDGAVGNEEELFRMIRSRLGGSRLFTVGIGSAPNSHFMTKAAQLGRGTFTYIGRIDEVRVKMGELFAKLEAPLLKGLEVQWPKGLKVEAWPARIPDLYAGEPVVVTAALDKLDGAVLVSGERDGRRWEAHIALERDAAGSGLGALWAREKVAALLDARRDGAAEGEVRAQILELATAHRLVTRYTSFVVVDKTPVRPLEEEAKLAAVPTLLPEGWEYDKVFGELPQGATDSRFALFGGSLALLIAFAMLLARRRFQ
jgi:Ca-activated chloride channel family protein